MHLLQSRKSGVRAFTGWVRRRIAALLRGVGKATAFRSATVPGRINPTTGRAARFNQANLVPEHTPAGCGEESPRSCRALGKQRRSGARPSQAASIRPPILRPVFIPEI
ncbi:MAG: hypothetical protein GX456_01595 [Verrucomicrobia bacterium]|nr:hypothetical protein [Verrucomicrobiota bacterium]